MIGVDEFAIALMRRTSRRRWKTDIFVVKICMLCERSAP